MIEECAGVGLQTETDNMLSGKSVILLAPYPPRKGGVTVQTELVARLLQCEGVNLIKVDTNLQKLRIKFIGTPLRLSLQPWVVAFRLLAKISSCDVLHIQAAANWGFLPAVIGVPIARMFKKKCVVTFQSGIGPIFMDRLPWLVKPTFKAATIVTVCSEELLEAFREREVESILLHNLFDHELFEYSDRNVISPNIVWTRSFEELYDPMSAIKAFEIVKQRYPDATIVMTSNGPLAGSIKKYVSDKGLSGVSLPGRVSHENIARAMADADICLNTTLQDGLPTALLEAAASGLPIVTTNAGGIASLYKHMESAYMVDPGDYEGLAQGIIFMLENQALAREMATKAASIAEQYTWPNVRKELISIYGFGEKN